MRAAAKAAQRAGQGKKPAVRRSSRNALRFPVVGMGASAGGLAAFEEFFAALPDDVDPDMAFVLVQHLDPNHKSLLTELIQRCTRMDVVEVTDGLALQPNHVYTAPANGEVELRRGVLHVVESSSPRGRRLPIDHFFRSLAQDQHDRAVGIVLAGNGDDGTMGLRAIKAEGGLAMAQLPASTEYDGMPSSAIATGLVDHPLAPADMPALLLSSRGQSSARSVREEDSPKVEHALGRIFVELRNQTGRDFSQYKLTTLRRRIERRMDAQQIQDLDAYSKYVQNTPAEVEALFRDLLIGVTSFFRDPAVFKVVEEQVLPRLFADKPRGGSLRAWVPGCSTGEEAYSLAMLLAEQQASLPQRCTVQVFATDIDAQAIATARAGLYPASIATDVSRERLARFFTVETDGAYRVKKSLRDLLVFSEQDVTKDPPFSRLDLVSCRNLLIYMGPALQKRLIPTFHYALNPDGYLLLGMSETVGECIDLFHLADRHVKLYQRKDASHGLQGTALNRFLPAGPPSPEGGAAPPANAARPRVPSKPPLREITEQTLLQQAAQVAVLVDRHGDVLYLHGRAGLFLEPSPGEPGASNIVRMARDGLRRVVMDALRKAAARGEAVFRQNLRVRLDGERTGVDVTVCPAATGPAGASAPPLFLVTFKRRDAPADDTEAFLTDGGEKDSAVCIAGLQQDLLAKEEHLQATCEQLQVSNEELKSSNEELQSVNEELQSVNEELQSTNEELETSKEELQSVNEEVATVNTELQAKVADLTRANNDMANLLAVTGIGAVFVDHQLRVLRYTPAAATIIHLIPSDLGRPMGHIASNLKGYDRLVSDTQAVLDNLIPKEIEVQVSTGAWYALSILPYRTPENVIEGAVITFVNISGIAHEERKSRAEEAPLRPSPEDKP